MSWRGKLILTLGVPLVLLLFFTFFHRQLLTLYAGWFVVSNAKPGADAIICLSGGRETRTPESLRLWNDGFAQRLFVTAEKPKTNEFYNIKLSHLAFARVVAERMKLDAVWEILPSLTGGASSTFDEAEDALAMAKQEGWERIILVTDEFHTRRALLAFRKVFEGSGIEVQAAGAANDVFAIDDWWKSDLGIHAYFGETIKFPIYLLWDHEPKIVSNH